MKFRFITIISACSRKLHRKNYISIWLECLKDNPCEYFWCTYLRNLSHEKFILVKRNMIRNAWSSQIKDNDAQWNTGNTSTERFLIIFLLVFFTWIIYQLSPTAWSKNFEQHWEKSLVEIYSWNFFCLSVCSCLQNFKVSFFLDGFH